MTDPVQSLCSSTYLIGLVSPLSLLHCSLTVLLHEIAIPVSEFWHFFISLDFHSGLSIYVGQNKLTQYVSLVWNDHWQCCIYISYKCQYFTFISFEMAESTLKSLRHIYPLDMLWDLLVSATRVSVLVGVRDMDNEQILNPVCVPYVMLLDFNSSATASPDQQVCSCLEGWEVPCCLVVLITFSSKLEFCCTS